jgi:hypothetical protein
VDPLTIAGTLAITYFLSRATLLLLGGLSLSARITSVHVASFAVIAVSLGLMCANAYQILDYAAAKPYAIPQLFWCAYDYFRSGGGSFRAA